MTNVLMIMTMLAPDSFLGMVLEWYAIGVIFLSPISFLYAMYLDKKKNIFGRIDAFVDRLVGAKPEPKKEEQKKPAEGKKEISAKEDKKETPKTVEDDTARLPIINLKPNDSYIFSLNENEARKVGTTRDWRSDNPFAGTIDQDGRFTADREGEAIISCSGENGQKNVYRVKITAKATSWSLRHEYDYMTKGKNRNQIRSEYTQNGYRVVDGNEYMTIDKGGGTQVKWKFDTDGSARAFLAIMKNTGREEMDEMRREADYRMKEVVKNENTGESQWIHMTGKAEEQTCDFVAILKLLKDGGMAFGASLYWRTDASENEVAMNRDMTYRLFEGMLPQDAIPDIAGTAKINNGKPAETGGKETSEASNKPEEPEEPDKNDEGADPEEDLKEGANDYYEIDPDGGGIPSDEAY